MKNTIGASIICMDHLNFQRELEFLQELNIDFLHLDVMDGHYVPRYGIYPEIVEEMAKKTNISMDLHIMTQNPEFCIREFIHIENIEYISVHLKGNEDILDQLSEMVRNNNKKFGIVIDLDIDFQLHQGLVSRYSADSIMFMGIIPGVLNQQHRPDILLSNVDALLSKTENQKNLFVQADGGVNFDTIPTLKKSGINNFVCGTSTLFKNRDEGKSWNYNKEIFSSNCKRIREAIET